MSFKEYLDEIGESVCSFAKRSFMSYHTILKVYNGERIKTFAAKRIVKVTKKAVTLDEIDHSMVGN